MKENIFQSRLIKELREMFEGCIVLKNDPTYKQGIPDLIILYKDRWAALECKRSSKADFRPNQEYYIKLMDDMSFARAIFPENKKEVLDDLQRTFQH